MILYTIVPEQMIYPMDEAVYTTQRVVNCNGADLVVAMGPNQQYEIIRVMSTDPQHYLQYEPGQQIWIH
ncbi:YlzJ-like family protein [Ectobacillus ponti]|uniref:YlzJ-like family protein n=1 Tax=Ectobacillus ponti TaxID=2961894 RepID=A0AA41XA19_9BACI|nr:YlzJ-like family protein [Ectobacillus ponti]MCP8969053.1 YlzJ-like family protein [Ectobacillus ponti]